MKRPPDMRKLEEILRSSKLVAGGCLGTDPRPLEEIIEADLAELAARGRDAGSIAKRMRNLTALARTGLGTFVEAGGSILVSSDDSRGIIVCPWPHAHHCCKTITTLKRTDTEKSVRWSDLSIHLIGEHGFFQGRGSPFRIEPGDLLSVLF